MAPKQESPITVKAISKFDDVEAKIARTPGETWKVTPNRAKALQNASNFYLSTRKTPLIEIIQIDKSK